jgi:chorismate dehydratase
VFIFAALMEKQKIRVAAVSYLNTKPLLYGIERHAVRNEMELVEDYPAKIAQMLLDNEVDVGLIPVAVIPGLKEHHIVTDYCIGADGEVASVCIFSDQPLEELTKIYLDYQSRTSVMLARVLLKEFWKSNAEIVYAKGEEYRNEIKGTTGGLVIGDRALEQRLTSKYVYDLGAAWKAHTGLPFVFAAWVSNKTLPDDFIRKFNEANALGVRMIPELLQELHYSTFPLDQYFEKYIDYQLDQKKRQGLAAFLEKIGDI